MEDPGQNASPKSNSPPPPQKSNSPPPRSNQGSTKVTSEKSFQQKSKPPPPSGPTKGTMTNDEAKTRNPAFPKFTCGELLDLALSNQEIGAVNFNILRMLLRDVIEKTGIDKTPVKVNDLEAHQVENFKNYVQGTSVASPMPGVLRIAQQGPAQGPPPGATRGAQATPRTPRSGAPMRGPYRADLGEIEEDLAGKVSKLEQQLESFYELPSNVELIERAKAGGGGVSVSDMWQIIQLNNRIAAAEAAIQKMASLIEDLAKNMGRVKGDARMLKKDTKDLATTNSGLTLQGQDLLDRCAEFDEAMNGIQKELNDIRMGWKLDRENMEKVLGVDLGKVPSFMRPKVRRPRDESGRDVEGTPSSIFERGTQTFMKQPSKRPRKPRDQFIPPEEIAKMSPADILANVTVDELLLMTPEIFKDLSPEQKKVLQDIRKGVRGMEPPKPPMGLEKMTDEELAELDPKEILEKLLFEEAMKLSPDFFERLTDEQKEMVKKVIERGPPKKATSRRDLSKERKKGAGAGTTAPPPKKPKPKHLGLIMMTKEQLNDVSGDTIARKVPYEEAKNIPQAVFNKMRRSQQEAIQKILEAGPPPGYKEKPIEQQKSVLGLASMNKTELDKVSVAEIGNMTYEEAKNIPPAVFDQMTQEQKDAVQKVIDEGPSPDDDEPDDDQKRGSRASRTSEQGKRRSGPPRLSKDEIEDIADIPAEDLANTLTPEKAAGISEQEMEKSFTAEQMQEIQRLKDEQKRKSKSLSTDGGKLNVEKATEMTVAELLANLTPEQLADLTEEELAALTPAQAIALIQAKKSLYLEEQEDELEFMVDDETQHEEEEQKSEGRKSRVGRLRGDRQHKKGKHYHPQKRKTEAGRDHEQVNVIQGPIPSVKEPLPPMSLEDYLGSLPPEEAANLAADAVQREMEKQYKHLQGMQRQLANDIQEKMEFIYQKLLSEIASNQLTTSPYMTIGGPETCLGPGICTAHGLPAGVAVCQFPEGQEKIAWKAGQDVTDKSVCPGPGVCPGSEVCPYCRADASAKQGLQELKGLSTDKRPIGSVAVDGKGTPGSPASKGISALDEAVLQEMKSLVMLDLEKIRADMKSQRRSLGAYDEQDILERLGAVWEALKILKHNEEAIAVRIARQDAIMKNLPQKTVEKLQKIPEENLDALITGNFGKLGATTDTRGTIHHDKRFSYQVPMMGPVGDGPGGGGGGHADKEDIATLFNNLANVIAECAEQKHRIDQIADTSRVLESAMVTKQMLVDAMSDKADRGLINTKVSYEEFGTTVDEIHNQLHSMMMDGYQRNENWKEVTTNMASELAAKLDRAELAPVRAFFKSHLKSLEEKVKNIMTLMEAPDPAGTRKKLLKDYNCISCDRMVNIAGITQTSKLPIIGPIPAGHPTASKRALELHRLRMSKKLDANRKDVNALERQGKQNERTRQQVCTSIPTQMECDLDVMNVVNRYTGGSHTTLTNAEMIDAQRRKSRSTDPLLLTAMANGGRGSLRNSRPGQVRNSKENLPPPT